MLREELNSRRLGCCLETPIERRQWQPSSYRQFEVGGIVYRQRMFAGEWHENGEWIE
jgi:hypothetical protein